MTIGTQMALSFLYVPEFKKYLGVKTIMKVAAAGGEKEWLFWSKKWAEILRSVRPVYFFLRKFYAYLKPSNLTIELNFDAFEQLSKKIFVFCEQQYLYNKPLMR